MLPPHPPLAALPALWPHRSASRPKAAEKKSFKLTQGLFEMGKIIFGLGMDVVLDNLNVTYLFKHMSVVNIITSCISPLFLFTQTQF